MCAASKGKALHAFRKFHKNTSLTYLVSQAFVNTEDGRVYASTAKAYDLVSCFDEVGTWFVKSVTVSSDMCGKFSKQFVHIICSNTGNRLSLAIKSSQHSAMKRK